MKKIIVLLILIISLSNFSQQKGLIYYGQIDALGYGEAKGIDLNSYMVFNKEQSYYVTAKDSLEKPDAGYQTKTIAKDEHIVCDNLTSNFSTGKICCVCVEVNISSQ